MIPRTIKQREIENDYRTFRLKKTINKDERITTAKYLCDECQKNYWTRKIWYQKSMYETQEFKMCDFCFVILEDLARKLGHRIHVLVMRRTEENAREIDKRLGML